MRKTFRATLLVVALLTGGVLVSAAPARNINPVHHPKIAAAQKFNQQAYDKIVAAPHANEWDMHGLAQKAKELLEQVNSELKLAAEPANQAR